MTHVALQSILDRRDSVPTEEDTVYPIAGVFGFGRGLIHRPSIRGDETKYATLTRLQEGDVVYSKVKAFEGAITVVGPEGEGRFVSPEFPVFAVADLVAPAYLRHVLAWDGFQAKVRATSNGVGARRERVNPATFLQLTVPVPDLPEQRRIAAHLDALAHGSHAASQASTALADAARALASRHGGGHEARIGDLVEQVQRATPVDLQRTYSLLGVRWYGQGLFVRERKSGKDISARVLYEIKPGDLVYNRLFAWKQSFAISSTVEPVHASGEFPAFRVNQDHVLPEFLLASLLTDRFTARVNDASSGSTPTSRNRLKVDQFLELTVPLPDRPLQERVASTTRCLRLMAEVKSRSDRLCSALLPAARNEIFSAMR